MDWSLDAADVARKRGRSVSEENPSLPRCRNRVGLNERPVKHFLDDDSLHLQQQHVVRKRVSSY
jgi:hypothetical protein